jgi:hypothetical protein
LSLGYGFQCFVGVETDKTPSVQDVDLAVRPDADDGMDRK